MILDLTAGEKMDGEVPPDYGVYLLLTLFLEAWINNGQC